MNLRAARLRLHALLRPRRAERELYEELAFHIEREARKHIDNGVSPAEARARARARFGSIPLAADQCRDVRGTAVVDHAVRDVLYAFRTFRRTPLVALTVVSTVALGLGLVAVVFTFFNAAFFRVDAVRNPGELFAVERPRTPDGQRQRFTLPEYEALRRETDVFADLFAVLPDINSRIDGRMMEGMLVTGNFFQVLGVRAALGRALTPADDEQFAGRPVIVLSHAGWSRLFDRDSAIAGRRLLVNGFRYEIAGVMPEGFRGLSVGSPDYWAPLSLVGQFRPIHAGRENVLGIDIVGRLKPGMSARSATAGLTLWASGLTERNPGDRRPAIITLEPRQGTIPRPAEGLAVFVPLFFAFGLILMIGCANVANLLLARGVARQREIGIRLALGASRPRIVRQLLTEGLLLALAAAACGLAISRVVLTLTLHVVSTTMPPEIAESVRLSAPAADWRMFLFLAAGAIVSTAMFGLAPALHTTRIELVRTMRGEVTRDARPGRSRQLLIAIQVGASALLLICAAVFLRSALESATIDPGLRTADTVIIDIVNEPVRAAMVGTVTAHPAIAAMAASWPDPTGRPRAAFAAAFAEASAARKVSPPGEDSAPGPGVAEGGTPGGPAGPRSRLPVAYRFVSPEYFFVFDIAMVRGRGFTQAERTGKAGVVVVSETFARMLWPDANAVGQALHLEADPHSETRRIDEPPLPGRIFTVVGVARDVPGFRLADFAEAGVYVPTDAAMPRTSLAVRVNGDPEVARRALVERLTAIDPNMGQVMTMRTLARLETYFLQIAFWLTVALGGLALVLTLSGLFSVLSYLVEQRAREIGVRMALGATTRHISRLVLSQSVRPVGFGLLAGGGLVAALATVLMATPAAALIGSIVRVFDPVAYAASLLCIVTASVLAASIPALRAARIDPMETLRRE